MSDSLDHAFAALIYYGVEFEDTAPELTVDEPEGDLAFYDDDDLQPATDTHWHRWCSAGTWPPRMETA